METFLRLLWKCGKNLSAPLPSAKPDHPHFWNFKAQLKPSPLRSVLPFSEFLQLLSSPTFHLALNPPLHSVPHCDSHLPKETGCSPNVESIFLLPVLPRTGELIRLSLGKCALFLNRIYVNTHTYILNKYTHFSNSVLWSNTKKDICTQCQELIQNSLQVPELSLMYYLMKYPLPSISPL